MPNPFVRIGNRYIGISHVAGIRCVSDGLVVVFSETFDWFVNGQEAEDLRNWLRHHSDDAADDLYKKRCALPPSAENVWEECNAIIPSTETYCEKHKEAGNG